jgi:glycosyltransferase involved in cell wall biosynthesis
MSHPEPSLQSLYFRTVVPALIDQCHHILTNTSFTANEIIKRTGIPAQKISIVPLGYDESAFFQVNSDINCSRLSSYFLHVGQQYPHKNIRRLIYSFSQIAVKHKNIRLVLAGKPHHTETPRLHRMVSELRMEQRISFQQYVKFRELPDLYRGAIALIYPSLTEGFGLPILEAMACGTPVITSLGSGTEEVAGDAALLVDAKNTREIAGAISEIINNATLRQEMTIQGLQRCKQFSWYRTAKTTRDILSCFLS